MLKVTIDLQFEDNLANKTLTKGTPLKGIQTYEHVYKSLRSCGRGCMQSWGWEGCGGEV